MKHGIEYVTFVAPFTATSVDDIREIHSMDLPSENREEGYFRSAVVIKCECGEEFTGYQRAQADYVAHL